MTDEKKPNLFLVNVTSLDAIRAGQSALSRHLQKIRALKAAADACVNKLEPPVL